LAAEVDVPILFSSSQDPIRRFHYATSVDCADRAAKPAQNRKTERKQYPALNAYSLSSGWGGYGSFMSRIAVVLIVEDELLLRMDAVDMIAAAGFEALEAGNADEAIEILEARPDVSVVFTDIQMPGSMDGLKLARAIRGRWPPIKIVATSGRPNVGEPDLPEGGGFCLSPIVRNRLRACWRNLRPLDEICGYQSQGR
jgi:CheY-like chemotaxis protein